ncbi:MAG: S1C family serine protease, partial [Ideonella sp.]
MGMNLGLRGLLVVGAWVAMLLPIAAVAQPAAGSGASPSSALPSTDLDAVLQQRTLALARASSTVVGLRSIAVDDAVSNRTLGRKREGSGVLIDEEGSLVLTVGYLIMEAEQIEIELDDGRVFPARVAAYDPASGFGLVKSLAPLPRPATTLGTSASVSANEPMMVVSGGADGDISVAYLASQRPFTANWEYHLDNA